MRQLPIHASLHRRIELLGADRSLVIAIAGISAYSIMSIQTAESIVFGVSLWIVGLMCLRKMSKKDPMMKEVYLRHIKYPPYLPAKSRPQRNNSPSQLSRYKW